MNLATVPTLRAMTPAAVDKVRRLEAVLRKEEQVDVQTSHLIHAGVYARTIRIPAGVVLTGVLIKRATVVIVNGHVTVFNGGETLDLDGYHVLPASAGRKQVFLARRDTDLTMLFPTAAQSVAEAEAEFTDDTDLLLERGGPAVITRE